MIPNAIENEVQDDARDFGRAVVAASINEDVSPRNVELLRDVYQQQAFYGYGYRNGSYGCCEEDVITLADGTPIEIATAADWKRNNWQVEFEQTFIGDKVACVTIPASNSAGIDVSKGRCSG